jgi:hypothetical protein
MGRYVYFSTGIEYKFGFAVQPSEDILAFGGYRSLRDPEQAAWIAEKDLDYIRERLSGHGQPTMDLSKYEKNIDGYYSYMHDIENTLQERLNINEKGDDSDEEEENWGTYYYYRLGHSIYFQLHMTPVLTAEYEG